MNQLKTAVAGAQILFLASEGPGAVPGFIIWFQSSTSADAYASIADIEPDHQYRWDETTAAAAADTYKANVLVGKSPLKGSVPMEDTPWSGQADPLFTIALEVVDEAMAQNFVFTWDLKPMFRLQAAYLLLWSAIERYLSLRYNLGDDVERKIKHLAAEPAFVAALQTHVTDVRHVYRADHPRQRVEISNTDPSGAVAYYYQIRCNIAHRGKGVTRDHERVLKSLAELLPIFRHVLKAAFQAAASAA